LLGKDWFGCSLCSAGLFGGCRHLAQASYSWPSCGACHWSLLRGFSDLCTSGLGRGSGLGLGNTTPSEHVAPAISEVQLLSGRLGSSGRRPNISGGCSASHYRPRRCPPRKGRVSLLPFPAAPAVGGVVTPAAAACKLFRCRALA
jgi:hypothetical protein